MNSLAKLCVVCCTMLWAMGCSLWPADSARRDREQLKKELEARNRTILKLTSELENQAQANQYLEAELSRTREVLEYAEKQFISLERGLQSHETKASAVAALAEAKLTYDKTLRDDPDAVNLINIQQAKDKIQKSDDLLSRKRYAASVYFAKRAIRLLEEQHDKRRIRIVSVNQANIRRGPGLEYEVVDRLALGTVLVELESTSSWLRVETRNGKSGWIHKSVTVTR